MWADRRDGVGDGGRLVPISSGVGARRGLTDEMGWGTAADWCPSAAEWERDVGAVAVRVVGPGRDVGRAQRPRR